MNTISDFLVCGTVESFDGQKGLIRSEYGYHKFFKAFVYGPIRAGDHVASWVSSYSGLAYRLVKRQ